MPPPVERLRQAGLKATGPRVMLLSALEQDRRHPTAEQLYESLQAYHPSLSLSTVYQTLDTFIRKGLCRRISDAGDRLRVDGTPQNHDHAVCRICGTIFDIDREVFPRPLPPAHLPNGLAVTGLRVEYDVICATCQPEAQTALPADVAPARASVSRHHTDRRRKPWPESA
jgi:Fur family transcriptional regulator, peroxide stress response regulator